MAASRTIFVSAVGTELRTSREFVAKTLRLLGCTPVWREFEPESREDIRPGIFAQIEECTAVIQIIGRCYGPEPPLEAQRSGRTSYAQYEALSARQCRKPVWHFIIGDAFPADASELETDARRQLQETYRNRVIHHATFVREVRDQRDLEKQILALRTQIFLLHRPALARSLGLGVLAIGILFLGWWLWNGHRKIVQVVPPVAPVVLAPSSPAPLPATPPVRQTGGDSITAQYERAITLRAEGEAADAEKLFREILAIRERLFGHEHPKVIETCYELALALRDQAKAAEARIVAHRVETSVNASTTLERPTAEEVRALLSSLGESPAQGNGDG